MPRHTVEERKKRISTARGEFIRDKASRVTPIAVTKPPEFTVGPVPARPTPERDPFKPRGRNVELGVSRAIQDTPPVVDRRAAIRTGSPDFQNLGDLDVEGAPDIFGRSSLPGGRLDTFVGTGAPGQGGQRGTAGLGFTAEEGEANRTRLRTNIQSERRQGGGAAPGSDILRRARSAERDLRQRAARNPNVNLSRGLEAIAGRTETALAAEDRAGAFREGTEADVLRTGIQQQGAGARFNVEQAQEQAAVELEGFRRFANISVPDGEGGFTNFEDIGGLNQVADMFGGERNTIELLRSGGISQDLLGGLVKLRSNLNRSEAFQEAGTAIRDLPEFKSDTARLGDFFNNGIGVLDIILGRGVLRSEGNPAIIAKEAFEGTGLTQADIAALVEQLKQGN